MTDAGPRRALLLAATALTIATVTASAQTTAPPYGLIPNGKYKKLASPAGNFDLEYPDSKDWKIIPGDPEALVTIAETKNGNASIILERSALRGALTADELVFAAQSEAAAVRERQPGVTNIQQQVLDRDGRRFVFVQYVRPGLKGPEQIVQYAFPIGTTMYRLICSAVQTSYPTYRIVFGHVAASFHSPTTAKN